MGKPILERMRRPDWWGDQGWHLLAGFMLSAPIAALSHLASEPPVALMCASGLIFSTTCVAIYEIWQDWGDEPAIGSNADALADTYAWNVGAALGCLVALGA